jgi:hypothetical protein
METEILFSRRNSKAMHLVFMKQTAICIMHNLVPYAKQNGVMKIPTWQGPIQLPLHSRDTFKFECPTNVAMPSCHNGL